MSVEPKVMEHVREALESFGDKYIDHGVLKRNAIIEDLDAYNERLMTELLSDDLIHRSYTKKIANVEIFEVNQFINMLEFKDYWEDSYAKYSNKIGLTAGGKFIDESADVVFDFPFKDTVLKAGMSKEDLENKDDADEPFLNEVIAKPEIDELFEPKVLVNAKQYDEYGVHEATNFNDQDNLVIKGNNLIALYSLKRRYAGRVNLIYLDPPFNTGSEIKRLSDAINGKNSGISKEVNWQGGGSFVYAELMEKNGGYLRDIRSAETFDELSSVFNRMKGTTDFDFRVDLDKFEEELSNFQSLDDRKKELIRILDKNQLYYNYANIDDQNVREMLSDEDYQFNKSFYEGGED